MMLWSKISTSSPTFFLFMRRWGEPQLDSWVHLGCDTGATMVCPFNDGCDGCDEGGCEGCHVHTSTLVDL